MKNIFLVVLLFLVFYGFSQERKKDSINKLEEVIVTATKSKRQLSNVTVPVTLIKSKDLKQGASLTLQNVLGEYTGLEISTTAVGAGIQLQGLDTDYTLIMIDGQPLVGRLNGTLDLDRLSVENIEQIEIVNGPSSVLYGSEALAGVINIITKKPKDGFNLSLGTKISSFNTYNLSTNTSFAKNKFQGNLSTNYYTTQGYKIASTYEGYNLSSEYYGKTVSPHYNQTYNSNLKYNLSKKIDIGLGLRYFREDQDYDFLESNLNLINGLGKVDDWNISPTINYQINDDLKMSAKIYFTEYNSETTEFREDNSVFKSTYYVEKYTNVEVKTDYQYNKKHNFTLGLGYAQEAVATSNLIDDSLHKADNKYAFVQYLADINKKLNLVVGIRFDKHDAYANQYNPKASVLYRITPTLTAKASIGRGFKKPTFKQLYYNYHSNAIGLNVFGTMYVEDGLNSLLNAGEIATNIETGEPVIYDLYYEIIDRDGKIEPESSVGKNLGFKFTGMPKTIIDVNFFRNDLKNLIEFNPIALKTNGWYAYSSENISRVLSQGLTLDIKTRISNVIKLSLGYQYLEVKDKDILDKLEGEGVYAQDPETLSSYRVDKKDYGGLLYRSKHTANFKFLATNFYKEFSGNFRVLYKGKSGFRDTNNNNILDVDNEYTDAYYLVNTSVSKSLFKNKLKLQVGIDNLLDFTYATPEYTISSLPGRTYFTTINYKF